MDYGRSYNSRTSAQHGTTHLFVPFFGMYCTIPTPYSTCNEITFTYPQPELILKSTSLDLLEQQDLGLLYYVVVS